MYEHLLEQVFEVFIRLKSVCFGGLRYAVENSTGFGSGLGISNVPVLFADTERPYAPFRVIVIKELQGRQGRPSGTAPSLLSS